MIVVLRKWREFRCNTPQIALALATTEDGLPVEYRLFSGNTVEISTLIECVLIF
jgi:transposase